MKKIGEGGEELATFFYPISGRKKKEKKGENHKQARFLFLSLLEKMNPQLVLWVSVRGGGRGKGGGRHSSQNDCGFSRTLL